MPTPNAVDRILARLKEGLLINLDKHSVERTRQIVEEETGLAATPVQIVQPKPRVFPTAPPTQDINAAIAKQKAEKAEALDATAKGKGMSWEEEQKETAKPQEAKNAKG